MRTQLSVLAIQAEQIKRQIEAMRTAAREHGLTFDPAAKKYDDTEAHILACETLWGQVWAGFHAAALAESKEVSRG